MPAARKSTKSWRTWPTATMLELDFQCPELAHPWGPEGSQGQWLTHCFDGHPRFQPLRSSTFLHARSPLLRRCSQLIGVRPTQAPDGSLEAGIRLMSVSAFVQRLRAIPALKAQCWPRSNAVYGFVSRRSSVPLAMTNCGTVRAFPPNLHRVHPDGITLTGSELNGGNRAFGHKLYHASRQRTRARKAEVDETALG